MGMEVQTEIVYLNELIDKKKFCLNLTFEFL